MKAKFLILLLTGVSISSIANENGYLSLEQRKEIDNRASWEALNSMLNPTHVKQYNINMEKVDRAQSDILKPPKTQRVRSLRITPDSSRKVHALHVYPNQITVITITDSLGQAWPLTAPPLVASDAYVPSYNESMPGVVTIQTKSKFIPSNMVISLKNRIRPIQFQLISDNKILDSMVEITIEGRSPTNKLIVKSQFDGLNIPTHDEHGITQFLDQAPDTAVELAVVGDLRTRAWLWNDRTVIRTPYTLVDPVTAYDVKGSIDRSERVYLIPGHVDIATFIDDTTSKIIHVKIQTGALR
ncbi:MAG: DotH/IcmK family type IV secretion protein [Colwellia sp.]